jgi:opacity protein-like surface antigen
LFVVGEAGRFRSLQPAADQSALDGTVSNLSSSYGVDLTGEASQKASYGFGGVRIQGSAGHHVTPNAMAGLGMAHVVQTATLTYTDGTLPGVDPSATAPDPGADVTAQLVSTGVFAQSSPENALMFSTSAGVAIDLARHITADVGYRFSHIGTTAPITAQGVAFGVGFRF